MPISKLNLNSFDLDKINAFSNRNMIINGNMVISQRNGTTAATAEGYTLDRWQFDVEAMDNLAFEISQTNDVPATFAGGGGKSLKYQTKTVESALASDELGRFIQKIEAQDCHRLLYGTSSAKSATLSFWVKSSLTGVFAVMMYMEDGALNIGSTYTISSADTWEYKTVTFVGNTSQAITHDNSIGLYVQFILMAGSSLVATDNTSWASYATGRFGYGHAQNGLATTDESTWQLCGVQFEVGEVATEFENESYADTLAKCQRFFYVQAEGNDSPLGSGVSESATTSSWVTHFPVSMRASPSLTGVEGTGYYISYGGTSTDQFDGMIAADTNTNSMYCYNTAGKNAGGNTAGSGVIVTTNNSSAKVSFNAEL